MIRYLYPEQLLENLEGLANDPSPQVRREIAVALTGHCSDRSIKIWLKLLDQFEPSDRWALEALGLATDLCPDPYFSAWKAKVQNEWNNEKGRALVWRVRSPAVLPLLVKLIKAPSTPREDLARYFRAFHFIDAARKDDLLADILTDFPKDTLILKYVILSISPQYLISHRSVAKTVTDGLDAIKGDPEWFTALATLRLKDQGETLWGMIMDETDTEKQKSAASALLSLSGFDYLQKKLRSIDPADYSKCIDLFGNNANNEMATFLSGELSRSDLDFSVKRRIVDALGNSGSGQTVLYQMIKAEKLQQDLKLPAAVKLLNCWNSAIRNEAPAILASIPGANLGQEPDIFTLARKTGDARKGKTVFQSHCTNCHQIGGTGIRFGPDLTEIGDKFSTRGLYQAILYPSAGVSFGYEGVNLTLHNGTVYQGYVESKTDEGIQLRTQSGQSISIRNVDIKERQDLQQSLMTEGLYRTFSQEDLVDLVTYLMSLKKQPDL
jgi:putative heme-binding domain-containing protein